MGCSSSGSIVTWLGGILRFRSMSHMGCTYPTTSLPTQVSNSAERLAVHQSYSRKRKTRHYLVRCNMLDRTPGRLESRTVGRYCVRCYVAYFAMGGTNYSSTTSSLRTRSRIQRRAEYSPVSAPEDRRQEHHPTSKASP